VSLNRDKQRKIKEIQPAISYNNREGGRTVGSGRVASIIE